MVADILAAARAVAAPGVTLKELDAAARDVLAKAGATSPFLNYHPRFAPVPYPAVICTSVNDAALHGIPGDYRLRDGDLLSVDAGATLDGWVGDAAVSFSVGTPANGDAELIAATEAALAAGIAAARPGGKLGDISAAIGQVGRAAGYGISTDLGGHGVGRTMHEDPHIPNRGKAGRGLRLVPGLVLAIEPWFIAGGTRPFRVTPVTVRCSCSSRTVAPTARSIPRRYRKIACSRSTTSSLRCSAGIAGLPVLVS